LSRRWGNTYAAVKHLAMGGLATISR